MRALRSRQIANTFDVMPGPTSYGSNRAGKFLKDAISSTDSVDIITFGDSNAGSNGLYGFTGGWMTALSGYGITQYATPMFATGDSAGANARYHGMFGPYTGATWRGNNEVLGIGTLYALSQATGADATEMKTLAGSYSTWKPNAFTYDANFVLASTTTFTSGANGARIVLSAVHPFTAGKGNGGVSLQYRAVYGTFTTTGGQFKLAVFKNVNDVVASQASYTPTSGGPGYDIAKLSFSSSTTSGVVDQLQCAWDGFYNSAPYYAKGPVAIFWHDVIRLGTKGWGVTNLNYFGGYTTTQIATSVSEPNKLLEMALKEARLRQIEAGGSGRVIWFHNSGINGSETSSTWTSGVESIRDKVHQTWTGLGYPSSDLAFIATVTHQTDGGTGSNGWETRRPNVSAAANSWASNSENIAKNLCVVDLASIFTASQLKEKGLYQQLNNDQYQSHLKEPNYTSSQTMNNAQAATMVYVQGESSNNGYSQMCSGIIRALTSFAP